MAAHKKLFQSKPRPALPFEGFPRVYVRDGVPGLPIERQVEMLEAIGLDLSDEKKLYIDRLSKKASHARATLKMRDQVIHPDKEWQRGEVVVLAGLRVLGWDDPEVMRSAATAFERGCLIYCADTGSLYSAETPAIELLRALEQAAMARRRARTTRATEGSAQARAEKVARGLAIAKEHWPTRMPMTEIEALSGLRRRTLYEHLPGRKEARAAAQMEIGKRHA